MKSSKKDIREFDPAKLAQIDVALWHAYYNHQFFRMFWLILVISYNHMGPHPIRTLLYAYYSSVAAIIFRKTKGRETAASNARILRYLEKFYALIRKHSFESFDYKKTAALELEWWFVDRYPDRYTKTRAQAFAEHTAMLYNVPRHELSQYALKRAQGMELLADYHHDTRYAVDWRYMEQLLRESYQALYDVLHA